LAISVLYHIATEALWFIYGDEGDSVVV